MPKIACYGFVNKAAGSVAGANFLILEELLGRGYEIDFFGWQDFNCPTELLGQQNFQFYDLPKQSFFREWIKRFLPKSLHKAFDQTIAALIQNLYSMRRDRRNLLKVLQQQHAERHYDLLLFLGLYGMVRVDGLPTISWIQGPPQTEWYYIHKLRNTVKQLCGSLVYWKLKAFYTIKHSRLKTEIEATDIFICGSNWSKAQLEAYGIPPNRVKVLPYPMDISFFTGELPVRADRPKTFLWLGRIDPRKRLDLMLAAFALLLKERPDVHLQIAGGMRPLYAGYQQLIDAFPNQEQLHYQVNVPRPAVPALIKSCDIVIQPSEGENFGSAVVEALCCGIPVVLGPTNGTKDFTSPSCCFVFADYTPEAVKQTMLEALQAVEQSAQEIAIAARKTAEQTVHIDRVVDDLEHIFQAAQSLTAKPVALAGKL